MAYPELFKPYTHGDLTLPHRIAMAPLTRNRAKGTVPGELNAEYYAQRASAAILITEGTHPAAVGQGYLDVAGLHNDEQQAGWAKVAAAVAAEGDAKLVVQLMHAGRVAHPYFTDGVTPVAPSAIKAEGSVITPEGRKDFVEPRALETDELETVKQEFVDSARRAVAAGAYGVELHAANGYLLNQFLADGNNTRTDGYGTTVEGRARFVIEVTQAVADAIGAGRTAIRLSPGHPVNDIAEQTARETFEAVLAGIKHLDLLYLHVLDTAPHVDFAPVELARELFPGTLMINEGFSQTFDIQGANDLVGAGKADLVAYGRRFIANPDLPRRLQEGAELNEPNPDTFYGGGAEGYTDYPALDAAGVS